MTVPEIRRVGVVGLGAMGAGIAQLAIEAGYETVGREVSTSSASTRATGSRTSSSARSRRSG